MQKLAKKGKIMPMNGQWLGNYKGTNTGHVTLNIEFAGDKYVGQLVFSDYNPNLPSSVAKIIFEKPKNNILSGVLSGFHPINKFSRLPDLWENVKNSFDKSVIHATTGEITATLENDNTLIGTWKTDINTCGNFTLKKSTANKPSTYASKEMNWVEFKEYATSLNQNNLIFRGQPDNYSLRTAYHRTGQNNFIRYSENIHELQHHVCAQTNRVFDLNDPLDYAALLLLGQHHGYPTPLLDWSESPFIAAYFAYSLLINNHSNQKVRIYIFDAKSWRLNTPQANHLNTPVLTIIPLKPMPIHNHRAVPQQSVTTFSNVDDMESFIKNYEAHNNTSYLTVVELPADEKKMVLFELFTMGINAGSLFPSLDGSCVMLKEKHFNL